MTLTPTPQPIPVGVEAEGGTPPSPSPLYGRCDGCGAPKVPARGFSLVCVRTSFASEPEWVLLCGTCFVDGPS